MAFEKRLHIHEGPKIHAQADELYAYTRKKFMKGFEVLASMGLSFDVWVYSTQLQHFIHWAKAFPKTSIVLDHLGTPAELFGAIGAHTSITKTTRENIQLRWQKDSAELT